MKQKYKGLFRLLPLVMLLLCTRVVMAQSVMDTLRYPQQELETIFLQNNLPLLAERLNIKQGDAKILQAKAWANPTFTLDDIQVYNNASTDPSPPVFGNFWRNRTFGASIEQLVYTAGKRRKNIALETRSKELAESTFTEMLQALKAEFRQIATELLYLQSVRNDWTLQFTEVSKLLNAQQSQYREGNISQSELFRLKALQISLQSELNEFEEQMTEKQRALKTLMNVSPASYIVITGNGQGPDSSTVRMLHYSLKELIDVSLQYNAGLAAARKETEVNHAALRVQKANSVPDLKFGMHYDRNGNNQLNFLGAGASIDLPFFDRNKGNIRVAQIEVQKSMLLSKNKEAEINNAIVKTWMDLNKAVRLYENIDKDYIEKLEGMTAAIARNFQQHNISLLEFLDFFMSFRESKEKYYESIKKIALKKEDLVYLTGKEL